MTRPLILLMGTAVVASIPIPAFAQSWPATIVAGAPQMAPRATPPTLSVERDVIVLRPSGTAPTQPGAARRASAVVIRAPGHIRDVPDVQIRPKAAWLDDQGLRLSPTRVAFKQRF